MKDLVSFVALLLLLGSAVQAEPLVSVSPARSKVTVGESFSVDIIMTDFPSCQGGGLSLRFKPSVVKVTKVTVASGTWSFAGQDGVIDNQRGRVSDILFSAFPGVTGNGVIATIELQVIGAGRTQLKLRESPRNPFASQGRPFVVTFGKGKVIAKPPDAIRARGKPWKAHRE